MKVVHCKKSDYDIYIGRGKCPKTGKFSIWGNPFIIGKDGNREEVIKKYEEYILGCPDLLAHLPDLNGKVLACWCAPSACHGDVLIKLLKKIMLDNL